MVATDDLKKMVSFFFIFKKKTRQYRGKTFHRKCTKTDARPNIFSSTRFASLLRSIIFTRTSLAQHNNNAKQSLESDENGGHQSSIKCKLASSMDFGARTNLANGLDDEFSDEKRNPHPKTPEPRRLSEDNQPSDYTTADFPASVTFSDAMGASGIPENTDRSDLGHRSSLVSALGTPELDTSQIQNIRKLPSLGDRTASTADRLRRQGFRASASSRAFPVKYTKRGSTEWRNVIQPFVSDIAFRSCVKRRFQGETTFRPYHCQAAVLFVDLSGYSNITTAMAPRGAHALSKVVNSYLSKILKVVQFYGGDVVNFAGDAILIVWEGTKEQLMQNVLIAAKCALDIQKNAEAYPVDGTDFSFRNHCGLACGSLVSEIFEAPVHTNMQRLYHCVGGETLYEIGELVDLAKAGEVCASAACLEFLGHRCKVRDIVNKPVEAAGAMILESLDLSPTDITEMDNQIETSLANRMLQRNTEIEEDFIHPNILKLLGHGGQSPTHIAQMRNLCVLFIGMTSAGSSVNWLMEVQGVLDQQRCPIVQIIDDDKGVHIIAAVNLYETVPEAGVFGLTACRRLLDRRVGCAIGIAMGPTFCGVTGSKNIACRWDITGPTCVRAARLMQYALVHDIPVAVDESLYAISIAAGRLEILDPAVQLKGATKLVAVYQLSNAKIQSAFRLLETVHARVHDDKMEEMVQFVSDLSRSACVVTGIPLSGKKILCQRVAGAAGFVPFLHVADPTNGLLQLSRTIAVWFRYSNVDEVSSLAKSVLKNMDRQHWSWAHDECIRLVNLALENGLRGCFIIDQVQFLDEFSVSLVRECMAAKQPYRHGSQKRCSSQLSSPVQEDKKDTGKICFLCIHACLFNWKTSEDVVQDITHSHRFIQVPVWELEEVDKKDLKKMIRDLSDMHVEDRWLDVYAESSGFCAGYFIERAAASRIISGKLWSEGKQGLTEISNSLVLSIPTGLAWKSRVFSVMDVNVDVAMRFSQIYDELPPLYQTVCKVLAISTGTFTFSLPRFVLWEVLNDLIAEGVEAAVLEIVLKEMVEMYLLKQEFEEEEQVFRLRSPVLSDISIAVCTPVQLCAIRKALLERLEILQMLNFKIPLVMARLHTELNQQDDTRKSLWQLSYTQMLNSEIQEKEKWKEIIHDEIRSRGYVPRDILGEEMESNGISSVDHILPLIKMYASPVSLGPLGTTLTVITRNIFHEWSNFHGATHADIAKRQTDTNSAANRYLKQMALLEELLGEHGLSLSDDLRTQEIDAIKVLSTPAKVERDIVEKAKLFLDEFVPHIVENRLQRLYDMIGKLKTCPIPKFLSDGDPALLKAYSALSDRMCIDLGCRQDAAQHALMILASRNWQPRPVSRRLTSFDVSSCPYFTHRSHCIYLPHL